MITYVLESSKDPSVPATSIRHGRGIRSLARDLASFALSHEAISLRIYGKHLVITLHQKPIIPAPKETSTQDDIPYK